MLIKVLVALFCALIPFSAKASESLLIKSATVIDGLGTAPRTDVDIEIVDGRIARIGNHIKSKASKIIDATGLFVVPGLIDCHTHLHSVPGAIYRGDSPEQIKEQQALVLRTYLAAGVTTVLDAAAPASVLLEAKAQPSDSLRILGLAPFLTPENGYFGSQIARGSQYADLWEPVHDISTVTKNFDEASKLNPLGAKVTVEKGFGPFDTWPVFNEETRKAIVDEASKHHAPLFIHSMSEEEHRLALSMHPYTLMHAGFFMKAPSQEILRDIKKSNAFVVSTLAIYKMMQLMWNRTEFNDPWVRMLVPSNQLETGLSSDGRNWATRQVVVQSKPNWAPVFLARMFSGLFFNEMLVNKELKNSEEAVKLMYDAGIPIVMGSDAGNWPVWTTFFHGVGSIFEMEALEEAGLPRTEILIAATSRAAKMLKIDESVGSIQEGKVGDLLLLNHNPLDGMNAFRNIKFVVKAGTAKSPQEWLEVKK